MTRFTNVKAGATTEDGLTLNNVEKVLSGVGIALRDASDSFRPLEDVIHDVAMKWESLNEIQRAQLSTAIAGTRQTTIFNALMQNYGDTLKYVETQENAAGLASERYAIYLESVEAAQNRLTASWEKLWQKTIEFGAITFFLDLASAMLEFISAGGGLTPLLTSFVGILIIIKQQQLLGFFSTSKDAIKGFILGIQNVIRGMLGLQTTAATTGAVVNTSLGYIGIAITLLSAAFMYFSYQAEKTLRDLEKLSGEVSGLYNEISKGEGDIDRAFSLADRYSELKEITKKTTEETKEFAEVQNNLKDILPEISGYYDEQGNFILDNVDSLGKLIKLKKEEIKLNKELLNQKLYDQTKLQTDSYQGQLTELQRLIQAQKDQVGLDPNTAKRYGIQLITDEDIKNQSLLVRESFNELQRGFLALSLEQQRSILKSLNKSGDEFQKQLREDLIKLMPSTPIDVLVRLQYDETESKQPLEDYFNTLLTTSSEALSGETKAKFDDFAKRIGLLNQQFVDGKISGEQYFSTLQSSLQNANLDEMFGGNTDGAQSFFTGMVTNAANSLSVLNGQFDAGEITLSEYTEQLTILSSVFQTIGDMSVNFADTLGLSASQVAELQGAVDSALGNISGGVAELQAMQELNMYVQQAWIEQTAGSLQYGSEAYATYMSQIAEQAAFANQTITDVQGNVISGSENIRTWLMADAGNFSILANQTANKTGESIQKVVNGAGGLLHALGKSIKDFKFKINFNPEVIGGQTVDLIKTSGLLSMLGQAQLSLPALALNVTGDGNSAVSDIGQALMNFGNTLSSTDFNFDASSLYGGGASPTTNPFKGATSGAGGLANNLKDASDNAKDLKDNLKDAEKAAIDSLKAQLKGYKDIIDARKKMLDSMAEERDYQNQVEDKNKEILKIQNELATLQLDDSQEAEARRLQLQDELNNLQSDLDDIHFDYSIDQQKAALDAEYQAFESTIENAIRQVQGIQATNLQQFAKKLSAILAGISMPAVPQFHDGGLVGEQFTMNSNETFAKLLRGEFVVTPKQMDDFMRTTLPALKEGSSSFSNGDINVSMPISISGNLDKSVIPDLEKLTDALINKINDKMMQRGWNRRADLYGI